MNNTFDGELAADLNPEAGRGPHRYAVSIRFPGTSTANMRLDIFDGIKKLGVFSIKNQKDHVYSLDFRSEFIDDVFKERLQELAGPTRLFEYTIEDIPHVRL